MGTSRFIKTPKLSIVLQITDAATAPEGRTWVVHDVERNRGFRVVLSAPVAAGGPADAVDGALGLAIERALVTPPEKVAGPLYDVAIAQEDFRDFASLSSRKS